ncbi:MAG: putative porin [Bacteroidota bacterium]
MFNNSNRFLHVISLLLLGAFTNAIAQQPDTARINGKQSTTIEKTVKTQASEAATRIFLDSIKKHRDSTQVLFFYSDFERLGKLNLHQNDTALAGFQIYDPLYKHDRFYATLGNIGLEYRSLMPVLSPGNMGFDYGIHSFDQYLYQNDSVKYYKVFKTYTELTYVQGAKKEQNFHAIFSRNIYRSFNLGFDFHVMSAPGAYYRQKANHINFVLTSQYFTKNKRYGVIANLTINRLRNYENGGLKNDSLFVNNLETNRSVIPVNLNSAQNRIKETGFFMKHYFDLTRHVKNEKDTTLGSGNRIDLGRLTYSFQYNRQIQNFIDNPIDSGFFPPPVLDTVRTVDSLTIKKIINELIWSNPSFKPNQQLQVFQIEAGIKQQYTEVSLHGTKNFFQQFIPHARINFTPFSSLRLEARGDYVLGDYNEGDFSLKVKLTTILGSQSKNAGIITILGNYMLQQPGWFYTQYQGNSFQWDTTWFKQGLISGGFQYTFKFLQTGFNISRINNYVYLDSLSQPRQYEKQFGHLQLYLNGNVDLWRFTFKGQLVYQTVQGTTVLRLPAFMGNLAIYYSQQLFHGAATLQPGLNFFYNTSYYADAYNSAVRSFYLQDVKEIGNSLYMDVFINLKIQRARFFVTYTHFNASFMGHNYFTTPGYPMQDGAFKFGVAWRFHD